MSAHWLTPRRLTLYAAAALIVYLVSAAILVARFHGGVDPHGNPFGGDFVTFWGASHLALSGDPAAAYQLPAIGAAEKLAIPGAVLQVERPWEYPPMFLLLVWPLALLPYFPALLLFLGLSFAGYFMVVRRILPRAEALLPLLAFPGVLMNAGEGQNGFLTAALMGGALLWLRTRPAWSGALIGLLTIKPHLGLLLPLVLLCGRHWRALAWASLSTVLFAAISVALLGTATLHAFFANLPQVAQWVEAGYLPLVKMPTFFAFARLLGLPAAGAYAVHFTVAALAAAAVAWVWLRCADFSLRAAALVAGTLLVSPYLFDYDLAWLALALAWFSGHALRLGWRRGERELLLLVWLLPLLLIPLYHLTHLQLAPFVLLALLLAILRRVRQAIADTASAVSASAQSTS